MTDIFKTYIEGVFEIRTEPFKDNRGKFVNVFRSNESSYLKAWGSKGVNQVNISETKFIGSIRGLHLQRNPYSESKLIKCLEGEVWDVAVDLRKTSKTFLNWISLKLSDSMQNGIIIPPGCAHGFQVLQPNSKMLYLHSGHWEKEFEIGYRWDDPTFQIKWPLEVTEISSKDKNLPFFNNDQIL